ncbi:Hypothetical protein NTJ_02229 [Nesidiocoris tenuis]|uniref:Uncharacterized protein n=1 Tax=Nesidiocoris tenuis TaxID=355587 RepID=A0ABN7AGF1_9HEMI|nr:Hypothetical protein NTJ_02229 [Nesidiocoris tenuis]
MGRHKTWDNLGCVECLLRLRGGSAGARGGSLSDPRGSDRPLSVRVERSYAPLIFVPLERRAEIIVNAVNKSWPPLITANGEGSAVADDRRCRPYALRSPLPTSHHPSDPLDTDVISRRRSTPTPTPTCNTSGTYISTFL